MSVVIGCDFSNHLRYYYPEKLQEQLPWISSIEVACARSCADAKAAILWLRKVKAKLCSDLEAFGYFEHSSRISMVFMSKINELIRLHLGQEPCSPDMNFSGKRGRDDEMVSERNKRQRV